MHYGRCARATRSPEFSDTPSLGGRVRIVRWVVVVSLLGLAAGFVGSLLRSRHALDYVSDEV